MRNREEVGGGDGRAVFPAKGVDDTYGLLMVLALVGFGVSTRIYS